MPNRILREGILTSAAVNKLEPLAELFYRRLISVVDDYGRYDARPPLLRAACFPLRVDRVREADIARWLTEVESAGLILLYAVASKPYLQLFNLGEPRAKRSKFPAPEGEAARTCAQMRADAPACALRLPPAPSDPPKPPRGRRERGAKRSKRQLQIDAVIQRKLHAARTGNGTGDADQPTLATNNSRAG